MPKAKASDRGAKKRPNATHKAKKAAPKARPTPKKSALQAAAQREEAPAEQDESEEEGDDDQGVEHDRTDAAMADTNVGFNATFPESGFTPATIKSNQEMLADLMSLRNGLHTAGPRAYQSSGENPVLPPDLAALFEAELSRGSNHLNGVRGGATEEVRSFDLSGGQFRVRKLNKPIPVTWFAAWDRVVLRHMKTELFLPLYEYRGFLFDLYLSGRAFDNIVEFDAVTRDAWQDDGVVVNKTQLQVSYLMKYGFEQPAKPAASKDAGNVCKFYQLKQGCKKTECSFRHVCATCSSATHGKHACTKGKGK